MGVKSAHIMKKAMNEQHWYSLAYIDGYPNYKYIKELGSVSGTRTHGGLLAIIDDVNGTIRFCPCYKKKYDINDCCAMLFLENEFMEIARKYNYEKVVLK